MKIELIIIGSEILNGKIQDKNIYWLARFLAQRGIELSATQICADTDKSLKDCIGLAWERSDVVITTGGLGPTLDDITKASAASFFQKPLIESQQAMDVVTRNYQHFERIPKFQTNGYAQLPEGFEPLANPQGLAPGLFYTENDKIFFAAPGVPREFQAMFQHEFYPLLQQKMQQQDLQYDRITIRTKGVPEEFLFFELCPELWKELGEYGTISSLPHLGGVDIGVNFSFKDEVQRNQIISKIKEKILASDVKNYIWQWGELSLPEFILEQARNKKIKISCAESCTGGLIANLITDIPGCSDVFMGGTVAYSNEAKQTNLDVNNATLFEYGAVSEETAKEMAIGSINKYETDIAIATSGIAGPGGGTLEKPVGTVAIAIATKKNSSGTIHQFYGDRLKLKQWFANKALHALLEEIEKS